MNIYYSIAVSVMTVRISVVSLRVCDDSMNIFCSTALSVRTI